MNLAREVKTERFSRTEGKTPAFVEGEVQRLLGAIETSRHTGLRDRALLGVLAYTFDRIGAVVNLKVEDYYPSGKRFLLRFKEKGGKEKELPAGSLTIMVGGDAEVFERVKPLFEAMGKNITLSDGKRFCLDEFKDHRDQFDNRFPDVCALDLAFDSAFRFITRIVLWR
jgi:integrase